MAKKDFNLPKHGDIDTKNLFVRDPELKGKKKMRKRTTPANNNMKTIGDQGLPISHLARLP